MKTQTFKLSDAKNTNLKKISGEIKNGAIAVIPTDTIYGIIGSAKIPETVEKIYRLRKRASTKPMIILVSSIDEITKLGIKINLKQKEVLKKIWPNKISVVFDCSSKSLQYLHRGKKSLAFRIPNNEFLLNLLKITGPVVAPSANFEGEKTAKNIEAAKVYFKNFVPFYIDAGNLVSPPSTVVRLEKLKLIILREGAAKIPKELLK